MEQKPQEQYIIDQERVKIAQRFSSEKGMEGKPNLVEQAQEEARQKHLKEFKSKAEEFRKNVIKSNPVK